MASGYGLHGGPGRCFPFWQEVLACFAINTDGANEAGRKICAPVLEDYLECLHHKKEKARVLRLQAAYRKAQAASARDGAPSAGQIRSLGLVVASDDSLDRFGPD